MKILVFVFVTLLAVIGTIQGFPQNNEGNKNEVADNKNSDSTGNKDKQNSGTIADNKKSDSTGNKDKQNSGTDLVKPSKTSSTNVEQSVVVFIAGGSPPSASDQKNTPEGGIPQNSYNGAPNAPNKGQSLGTGSLPLWLSNKLCGPSIILGMNRVLCSAFCLNFYRARSGSCTSYNACVCTN